MSIYQKILFFIGLGITLGIPGITLASNTYFVDLNNGSNYPNLTSDSNYAGYGCAVGVSYATSTRLMNGLNYPFSDDSGFVLWSGRGPVCDGNTYFDATAFGLPDGSYIFEFGANKGNPFQMDNWTEIQISATGTIATGYLTPQTSFSTSSPIIGSLGDTHACDLFTSTVPYFNFNFNLGNCVYELFVPDPNLLTGFFDSFQQGFLSRMPLGYITRFIVIASGNATSTLPTISIPIPTPQAGSFDYTTMAGTLDLTPWNDLMGTTSMFSSSTNPVTGHNFRQIVEPGWDTIILVLFGIMVIHELLGITVRPGFGSRGSLSDTDTLDKPDDSYKLKEKLWEMSQRK